MTLLPSTVQLSEIVFSLFAVAGLWLWAGNRITAGKDLHAARGAGAGNGVLLAARYAVRETRLLAGIEIVIVAVGVLLMCYEPNPSSNLATRWGIGLALIAVSVGITALAYDWRQLGEGLRERAKAESGGGGDGQ